MQTYKAPTPGQYRLIAIDTSIDAMLVDENIRTQDEAVEAADACFNRYPDDRFQVRVFDDQGDVVYVPVPDPSSWDPGEPFSGVSVWSIGLTLLAVLAVAWAITAIAN